MTQLYARVFCTQRKCEEKKQVRVETRFYLMLQYGPLRYIVKHIKKKLCNRYIFDEIADNWSTIKIICFFHLRENINLK